MSLTLYGGIVMGAWIISQLISPKAILIGLASLFVMFLVWEGIHFEENYVSLQKQNVSLQQNISTYEAALKTEQQTAATEQKVAQATLVAVEQKNTQENKQLAIISNDNAALQLLRTPTNEDNKCVTSPYVSTVLERMRLRDAADSDDSNGSGTSDAPATSGINNTTAKTSNSP